MRLFLCFHENNFTLTVNREWVQSHQAIYCLGDHFQFQLIEVFPLNDRGAFIEMSVVQQGADVCRSFRADVQILLSYLHEQSFQCHNQCHLIRRINNKGTQVWQLPVYDSSSNVLSETLPNQQQVTADCFCSCKSLHFISPSKKRQ